MIDKTLVATFIDLVLGQVLTQKTRKTVSLQSVCYQKKVKALIFFLNVVQPHTCT